MTSTKDRVFWGVAFAIAAYSLFSLQSLAVKILAQQGYHPIELSFWRCILSLVPFALWIIWARRFDLLVLTKPWLMALRVVMGIANLWFLFATLYFLPMSNATILFMANVLITPILAIMFLKEHVGPHRWAAIGFGFMGVVLAAAPSWEMSVLGLICGLSCAFLAGGVKVSLRGLRDSPPLGTAFYFIAGGTVLSTLPLPWVATDWPHMDNLPLFMLVGLSGLAGQIFISFAFSVAPASIIAPFDYTGLLWAVAFDGVLWGIIPGWPVFGGAGMILAAHLYMLHRERIRTQS